MKRLPNLYTLAAFAVLLALILGIAVGPTALPLFNTVRDALRGTVTPDTTILLYVRLPRVLAALVCGAALSVSGAVIQSALANPLASPSIIGVNAGAGLAVTVCSAIGLYGSWILSTAAFVGAFITVLTVALASKKWGASRSTVILIGVALNALLGAISDTVITFAPTVSMMQNDFKVGDFAAVTLPELLPAALVVSVTLLVLLTLSNELDILTLGDETARGLGLSAAQMRVVFLLLAALLAGTAVSVCGLLSFVGLLVPHAVRRLNAKTCHLLPLCALLGYRM